MAKVISNYKEVIARLKRDFNAALDENALNALGDAAIVEVQKRTRLGKDVDDQTFDPLKPSTIDGRNRLKNSGELSPFTTPRRSNQTATGQMVESLQKRINDNPRYVEISMKSARDDGTTNQQVLSENRRRKRDFFGLSPKNKQTLGTLIRNILRKIRRG